MKKNKSESVMGISCIIQINAETSFVSDSSYLHVFDRLDEVHHQMEEIAYKKKWTDEKNLIL